MNAESDPSARGLLDTNVVVFGSQVASDELPPTTSISTITVAELSAGVHAAPNARERARRIEVLQQVEGAFEPLPFDLAAARRYGSIAASVRVVGRSHRSRVTDLMIASVAAANGLPLYTMNVDDFVGLEDLVEIVPVTRPTP